MQGLYVVGTAHKHDSSLLAALERLDPDQVLLEMLEEDARTGEIEVYQPEVVDAYAWAQERGKTLHGIYASIDPCRPDVTSEDIAYAQQRESLCFPINTLELNKRSYDHVWQEIADRVFDKKAFADLQGMMAENIREYACGRRTLLLVGAGHLAFLEGEFPDATFPFRNATVPFKH